MSTGCPKCGLEHEPVGVLRWLWLFRDTKPKPTGKAIGILVMLATRMDAKTGCGWTTDPDLADLAEVDSLRTVYAATRWARDRLLVFRARKGYRITGERGQKSLWILTDPATQPAVSDRMGREPTGSRLPHGKDGQPAAGDRTGREPTGNLRQANRQSDDDPTGNRLPSIANPEKLNQEVNPTAPTTPATRARAPARDPRLILRGLLTEPADDEIDFIITKIEARPNIPDTARYLLDQIGTDNGERFIKWARKLGVDGRVFCGDPRCDHGWINADADGQTVRKCPNRHRDTP